MPGPAGRGGDQGRLGRMDAGSDSSQAGSWMPLIIAMAMAWAMDGCMARSLDGIVVVLVPILRGQAAPDHRRMSI